MEEILTQMGKILAYIIAVYILYDSIICLYMCACMEILHTAEGGKTHKTHWKLFILVNSCLYWLRGVQDLSGSQADDRSVARSVFSSFESPMAHKVFANISYCCSSISPCRESCSPEQSSHPSQANLTPAPPSALGHTQSNLLPAGSKRQPSSTPDTLCLGEGDRKHIFANSKFIRKIPLLSPHSFLFFFFKFFFPHFFKCQSPTQFLWKFEQLVSSVWKQNKLQHISPFGELSRRQHAFQSGDDSVFSSLGLGCRPKNSKHFLYICVESGLISD